MKKYRLLLFVGIGLMTILVSCKDKTQYCPAYPQDDTDYLPVDFIGQTLRYVFDDDTMELKVLPAEFSERYENNPYLEFVCASQAWQRLESDNSDKILRYQMSLTGYHIWSVAFHYSETETFASENIYDIYGRTGNRMAEILPQWTAPTGTIYRDILKSIQNKIEKEADTLYLSRQYGLVHWIVPSEQHTLTLLP